jgi:hypothetical protein
MATEKEKALEAVIINAETGETTTRLLTADEIDNIEQLKIEQEQMASERTAKLLARENALAKLADLGLTEEEVAAL